MTEPDTQTQPNPAPSPEPGRERRLTKERIGEVISDKMSKTIVVRVERRVAHPRFRKIITRYTKHYAHDDAEKASLGDTVRIREVRPLSKLKRWTLVEVVRKASTATVQPATQAS